MGLLSVLFISSCTTDEYESEVLKTDNKYVRNPIGGEWDESYHPNTSIRSVNESYEFVPVGVKNIYTGLILKGDELNNGKMMPILE